jgi:hypothetical protein
VAVSYRTKPLDRAALLEELSFFCQLLKKTRKWASELSVKTRTMRFALALALASFSQLAIAGYDLHITRIAHWSDENGPTISFSEWLQYLKIDKEVRQDEATGKYDFLVQMPGEFFPMWYNPELGILTTKNPSEKAIEKLIEISKKLKAKVQGDDGELYPTKR